MKQTILRTSMLAGLCAVAFSSSAFSMPIAGNTVILNYGSYGKANYGGEFALDVQGTTTDYIAFCLERDEYVSIGGTYTISSVSDTVYGGGKNTNSGDDLSTGSQWLMYNYVYNKSALKTLTGVANNDELANKVQLAIWSYENELDASEDVLLKTTADAFIATFSSQVTAAYDEYVTAINLGTDNQSMIVADPIPEPTTMLLFGTGIAGLAGIARRKRD